MNESRSLLWMVIWHRIELLTEDKQRLLGLSALMSYKASKEAFVSDTTGSSILHVNLLSSVSLASVALYSALRSRLPASKPIPFLVEWALLSLPLLLSITLFANRPALLCLIILLPTAVLLFIPARDTGTTLPSNSTHASPSSSHSKSKPRNQGIVIASVPALTTYRAHMMLLTVQCILAVDFPVFPRSLAKCETWGVSLMDIGVGSFMYSQGIISAIPLLKNPTHLTDPLIPKLISAAWKSLPIIVLGLARVVLVKATEYPEHESEYGTHWNFFLTLAVTPALQVLLHPIIKYLPVSMVGILLAISHQVALSLFGWQNFALYAPRDNIISANKEGLVSLLGYLSIHLLGLSCGTLLLPPSPSYFRRRQQAIRDPALKRKDSNPVPDQTGLTSFPNALQRKNDKTATELFSYAVVWWVMLGMTMLLDIGGGISRRMANLSYILWIAAFNTSFLFCYILLDLYFFPSPLSKSFYSPISGLKAAPPLVSVPTKELTPPPLLDAINKNGLVVFLAANVATGLINLAIPTMYTSDAWAMVILAAYTLGICAFAWTRRGMKTWQT